MKDVPDALQAHEGCVKGLEVVCKPLGGLFVSLPNTGVTVPMSDVPSITSRHLDMGCWKASCLRTGRSWWFHAVLFYLCRYLSPTSCTQLGKSLIALPNPRIQLGK